MEVILKCAESSSIPEKVWQAMLQGQRQDSGNQYNTAWRHWMDHVRTNTKTTNIADLRSHIVADFLMRAARASFIMANVLRMKQYANTELQC